MTMRVTMLQSRRGEGVDLVVGNTYTVDDELGQELVYKKFAIDTDGATRVPSSECARFSTDPLTGMVTALLAPDGTKVDLPAKLNVENALVTLDKFAVTSAWTSASTGVPVLSITSDLARGNALRLTTDGTTNNHDIVRAIACSLTKGQSIAIDFKPDANISVVNIALSVGGSAFTKTVILLDDAVPGTGGGSRPDYFSGQWKTLTVSARNVASYGGGAVFADLNDVRAIRIRVRTATAVAGVADFANFRLASDTSGLRVIFQFDDARLSQYSKAYPILSASGYKGTIAVPPADLGQTLAAYNNLPLMTESQCAELYAAGWEFLGHHGTSFSGMTNAQITACLDTFLAWSSSKGFPRGRSHWVYVGGWFDTNSSTIVNRQFLSARRVSGTSNNYINNTRAVFEPSQIGSVYLTQSISLASAKARLDTMAALGNGVVIFTGHEIVDSYSAAPEDWLTTDFAALVAYAKQLGFVGSSFDNEFGTNYIAN